MPGVTLRIFVLNTHEGGNHGLPSLAAQPEAAVQLVADVKSIFEVKGDERGRDMAGEAPATILICCTSVSTS